MGRFILSSRNGSGVVFDLDQARKLQNNFKKEMVGVPSFLDNDANIPFPAKHVDAAFVPNEQ